MQGIPPVRLGVSGWQGGWQAGLQRGDWWTMYHDWAVLMCLLLFGLRQMVQGQLDLQEGSHNSKPALELGTKGCSWLRPQH